MADINVERKGPSIWPWIIGLIVLALLIWALAEMLGDDDEVAEPVVTEEVAPVAPVVAPEEPVAAAGDLPPAVTEYTSTCVTGAQPSDMGLEHQYTSDCIQRMVAALDAVVTRDNVQGTDVSQRLTSMRQTAQQLQASDAQATNHANMTRDAFVSAADLIGAVHQAGYTNMTALGGEVTQVRDAAQAVQPTTPMLDQRDAVQTFFREAGDAIRMMAERPAAM